MQPSGTDQDGNANMTPDDCASKRDSACAAPLSPLWLMSLLPIVLALFICFHYGFEAPYMDQWELVPLIEKALTGHVTFGDLWAQHNVHRIPIPKLIMLVLARLSHWDTRWERVVSMTFACAGIILLLQCFRRNQEPSRVVPWAWLVIVTLFFSAAQWENLLWGWHLLIYLNLFGAILVGVGLRSAKPMRLGIPIAVAGAIFSVFSYGNGLILLPVGVAVLALRQWQCKRFSAASFLAWGAASFLIGLAYIWHFQKPSYDPSYAGVVTTPTQYVYYILAYLGAPLASFDTRPAAFFGIVGLCVYAFILLKAIRKPQVLAATLPFDGLALYSIGTAFLTATARTGFGVVQALSPRYIVFSSLLWIAIVVHLCRVVPAKSVSRPVRYVLTAALLLIGMAVAANSALGVYRCDERHDGHIAARDALVSGSNSPELLRRLYPDEETVIEGREKLIELRLNVFR